MSGYNMAAAGMYGLFPNLYNNQIALNDLTGLDVYPYSGMAMDPMLTMNGSVFGMNAMGAIPYMPGYYGGDYSYENYFKNFQNYQDFMINNNIRMQENMRNADLKLNSPLEGISKKAGYLHDKIMRNEQQQIQLAYRDFIESVRSLYPNASEEEINNRATTMYKQINGCSVMDDIRQNGRDSFTQGFLQTLTFGFADNKTAEENIALLTGQPVGRSEDAKKFAGNVAGGAVVGGGLLGSAGLIWKGIKTGAKSKTFLGIAAGAVIGTLAALGIIKNSAA